jgi:regulator of sigma E protease
MMLLSFTGFLAYVGKILLALVILLFMITVHEFGHFIAGKMLKFKINEFAVGMGPKILSKKAKDGQVFSLRAIPLGGFCAFEGEDEAGNVSPQAFNNQKPWKRIVVLSFGALFNFISAVLIAIIAFSAFGDTVLKVDNIFEDSVNSASYGTEYGFCKDDIIYSIDGKTVFLLQDIPAYITKADDTMNVVVLRKNAQGKHEKVNLTVRKGSYHYEYVDDNGQTQTGQAVGWGIQNTYSKYKYNFGQSIVRSVPYCCRAGSYILETLGGIITGKVSLNDVGGPITTIDITTQVIATGFGNTLFLIILISVNLAVFNLLPLPALDGARIVFVLIEMIFKKPVNRRIEAIVHTVGLIILFALVIILDIARYL